HGRWDRKQDQSGQDANATIDVRAEVGDAEAGDGHSHGAGIDGESHCSRGDTVVTRERGKDGLRGEKVYDSEERRKRDDEKAEKRTEAPMRLRYCIKGARCLGHGSTSISEPHGLRALRVRRRLTCDGRWDHAECRTTTERPACRSGSSTSG